MASLVSKTGKITTEMEKHCEISTIATFWKRKLHIIRQYSRPWHEITAMSKNHGTRRKSR